MAVVTWWQWVLVGAGALVLAWVVLLCRARIGRLHRLHRRTDAARAALESALQRRAAAALAAAGSAPAPDLLRAAVAAVGVPLSTGAEREVAENALGRRLAAMDRSTLPAPVLAELVDAEQLLGLARRVHNDAVRDTLGLRSRRLVRWLHLAGTAPMPAYFEIADADAGVTTAAPAADVEAPAVPPR